MKEFVWKHTKKHGLISRLYVYKYLNDMNGGATDVDKRILNKMIDDNNNKYLLWYYIIFPW